MSGSFFTSEGPYRVDGNSDKAPEAISKAVASLPSEQMFELMKQMKHCIQNNPAEARNMLLQNPELAYALLQAQVVMKIVEPQVALSIFNRPSASVTPTVPTSRIEIPIPAVVPPAVIIPPKPAPVTFPEQTSRGPLAQVFPGAAGGIRGALPPQVETIKALNNNNGANPFPDPRTQPQVEPRDPRNNLLVDPRGGPGVRPPPLIRPPMMMPPQMRDPRDINRDPRGMPHEMDVRPLIPHFDPRMRGMDPRNIRGPEFEPRPPMMRPRFPVGTMDQRSPIYDQRDPRNLGIPHQGQPLPLRQMGPPRAGMPALPNPPASQQEQEKTALIMQVLQLSDQQIAMLPPEQRQSIMVLKEQIARSAEGQK